MSNHTEINYKRWNMNDIHDEARLIAVRWVENFQPMVGSMQIEQKVKLASDIMSFATALTEQAIAYEQWKAGVFAEWIGENFWGYTGDGNWIYLGDDEKDNMTTTELYNCEAFKEYLEKRRKEEAK